MVKKAGWLRSHLIPVTWAVLSIAIIYVVLPQLKSLKGSWQLIDHANGSWVLIAVVLTFSTFLSAAGTYYFLAFKPLSYWKTVLVQLAAMFVNKLLPGGIGALGANYAYLRKARHSQAQAASVVTANNLIGVVGHLLVAAAALLFYKGDVKLHHFAKTLSNGSLIAGLLTGAILLILFFTLGRSRFFKGFKNYLKQLANYKTRPTALIAGLLTSMSLTLLNVLCLAACSLALGVHLPFITTLLVFTLGISTSSLTPTPGGLGGFEAGLFAGFVAYHVAAPSALAAALLYRLVSYWVPLLAGAVAFIACQKKHFFIR